jgi:predicted chitinase
MPGKRGNMRSVWRPFTGDPIGYRGRTNMQITGKRGLCVFAVSPLKHSPR